MKGLGIKVGRQNYTYHAAGEEHSGENVYGILQAPRGDATEAIVLVAPWESIDKLPNRNGVALALTMARYFKRMYSTPKLPPLAARIVFDAFAMARLVSLVKGHNHRVPPRQQNRNPGLGRCLP